MVGGKGARFFLEDGRAILDLASQAECCNLGHQHPRVVAAIQRQAGRLCYIANGFGAGPRAALARRLLDLSGFDGGRVYFTLGGADANEHAVRFARLARGLPDGPVVTRERSYHGASHFTRALSGDARGMPAAEAAALGVVRVPPPYAYRCPFATTEAEACGRRAAEAVGAAIDEAGAGAVAAVLMEPDAGTNGIVPPESWWPALRAETAARGVPLIADEVMCGFGRCGEWFAWQRFGEGGRPEMITLAKGLTGAAAPLGAVVMSRAIAEALAPLSLPAGLTYAGHPLCCAAGVAAIEAYEAEDLIERSRRLGGWLIERLRALQQRHAVIGEVRGGRGLFAVIELVKDRVSREPLAPWPATPPALAALVAAAFAEDLHLATRGNLIILAPPLVIEEDDLGWALDKLDGLIGRHLSPRRTRS